MENVFKRFLALALAVFMVVGMLPMNALAEEATSEPEASQTEETGTVAEDGEETNEPEAQAEGNTNEVVTPSVTEVATKADLTAAIAAAKDGDTIRLTADIDYGTDHLKIEKAIILDLGGKTLTTRARNFGIAMYNGCSVTNGKLNHAGTVAAIKVWNAKEISNLEIDVTGTSSSGNAISGIVIQENAAGVAVINNVTIHSTAGQGVANGIETYNCGNAASPVIGSMVNVTIKAVGTAMNISAPCGTATGCTFEGGKNGIELWIKGTYSASLNLVDCDVTGGVYAHDEFTSNPNVVNSGTLTLTADAATSIDDVALTINHAEEDQVKGEVLESIIANAVAKADGNYYTSLKDAVAAGGNVILLKDVTLGEKLTISGNVTITGNATITRADYTGTLFEVAAGATLTLDGGLTIDGANAWVYTKTTPELDMANGAGTKVADHITPAEGGVNATEHLIVNNGALNANKVTIQNSYSTSGVSVINCGASSVTTLNGATIQHTAANRSGAVVNVGEADAVLTIKGDTRITGNFGIGNGGIIQNYGQGTTVNMEGGRIDNNHIGSSGTLYATYSSNANKINTFNMSGGIITKNVMEGYGPVYIHTNSVWNMTGGEISENTSFLPSYVRSKNNAATISGGKIVNNEITGVNYSGGYYANRQDIYLGTNSVITGGTFTQDVEEYLADGSKLVQNQDGTYGAQVDPTYGKVAKIGETGYATLADAIAAANDGDTITVIADHELVWDGVTKVDGLPVLVAVEGKTVTIDLNGKNLTGTSGDNNPTLYAAFAVNNDGVLTLKDSVGTASVKITGSIPMYSLLMAYEYGANKATKLIVEGGSYYLENARDSMIFCGEPSENSSNIVYIKGGSFTLGNVGTGENGKPWIGNVVGSADNFINVSGGTFNSDINRQFWSSEVVVAKECYVVNNGNGTWTVKEGAVAYILTGMLSGPHFVPKNIGYATLADAIAAVDDGDVVIELLADATFDYNARDAYGAADTTSITINGNGHTLTLNQKNSDWASIGLANANAKLVLNNMTIEKTGYGDTTGAWNTHAIIFSCNVEMNNVTVNNGIAVQNGATLKNVTINEANGYYGLWINGNGQTVTVEGGAINATNGGRGIKIADEYVSDVKQVTLTVDGTKFNTAKKAAVLVSSKAGAAITASNVDISNVAADTVNFVWVDSDWSDYYNNVTVTGCTKAQEDAVIKLTAADGTVKGYFMTIDAAIAAAQAGDTVTILAGTYAQDLTVNKAITVVGEGEVKINGVLRITADGATVKGLNVEDGDTALKISAKNVLVEDCVITGGWSAMYQSYTSGTVTFQDSTITGKSAYAIHFDGSAGGNIVIDNCVITGWTSFARTIKNVSVTKTTFAEGTYNYLRFYQENVVIDGCTFNENMAVDLAVNGAKVTVTNSTVTNGTVEGLFGDADIAYSDIYVDGVKLVREAKIGNVYYKTIAEAIAAAKDGDEVVILAAGTYNVPTGKNITITGAVEGVKFDMSKAVGINSSMTFNNVTFEYGNANYVGLQHAGTMVYNDCTFNGQVFLYGTSETFNRCTFNQNSADAYNVWTYGAKEVAFNECTFNSAGKSVLIYSESASVFNNVTVTDCDFIASAPVDGKAAIEMDSSLTAGIKLTIDAATTVTGFGTGNVSGNSLWNNKKGNTTDANNDITVIVDNVTVLSPVTFVAQVGDVKYESLKDAIKACTNGETVKLIADITYDADDIVNAIGGATGFGQYPNPAIIDIGGTAGVNGAANQPSNVNAVLDLNGHTITNTADAYLFLIMDNAKITFKDSSKDSTGAIVGNSEAPVIWSTGTDTVVTIESGKYSVGEYGSLMWATHSGDLVITGGEFKTTASDASLLIMLNTKDRQNSKFFISGKSKVTVTGGRFYGFNPEKMLDDSKTPAYEFNAVHKDYIAVADGNVYTVIPYIKWVKAQLLAGNDVTLDRDIVLNDISYVEALPALSNGNGAFSGFNYGNGAFFNVIGGNVTFDLNGHSITYDIHHDAWCNKRVVSIFYATDKANLTITDSVGGGKVDVYGMASAVYSVAANTKVTIEGGTWTWNPCKTCGASNVFLYASHGGELYITGGTFVNNVKGDAGEYMILSHYSSKETTENWAGVDYDSTKVEISGGTFHGYNPGEIKYMDNGNGNKETMDDGCAPGYAPEQNDDGTWTVVPNMIFEFHLTDKDGNAHWLSPLRSNDIHSALSTAKVWYDSLQGTYNFTLKILESCEIDEPVVVNFPMTIDLNGNTLTGSILVPNAELTVKNGSIVNTDRTVSAIEINAGKLTLENVNITSARHAVRIDGAVDATIKSGKFMVAPVASGTYHAVNVSGAANVTIVDGTFVGPKGTQADSGAAVKVQKGATVTIEGGNFSGGKNSTLDASGTLTVTGGTYNQDPTAYVAKGYEAVDNGNGTWSVVPNMIFRVHIIDPKTNQPAFVPYIEGNDLAATIAQAKNFYANYYTMKLEILEDCTITAPAVVDYPLIADLSGITLNATGDAFVVKAGGVLTLNGTGVVNAGTSNTGSSNVIWADGGKVIVNGGTYSVGHAEGESNDLIYTKNGGTVDIYGGTFLNDGVVWTLNQNDANGGKITVYGGTFQNWNPADNVSEGAGTNFVAEGYESVDNGNGTWTVVEKTSALFEIERTNMRFGSDLSLLFAFKQSNVTDINGSYAKIYRTVNGTLSTPIEIPASEWTTTTIAGEKYFVLEFSGLAAKEMTDNVYVTIYDAEGNALSKEKVTSIRDYAMDILGKTTKESYKIAIVDMLNYGYAAQKYFDNYNISEPANGLLTPAQKDLASDLKECVDDREKDDAYFGGSNLRFVNKINLIFRLKIDFETYAVFTWTNHDGKQMSVRVDNDTYTTSSGYYVVELEDLVVADARQKVTCTIYRLSDNTVVTTVVDSVASNVARRTTSVAPLYEAFMKFADSAHNYLHNK